jgi:hypothetical protein
MRAVAAAFIALGRAGRVVRMRVLRMIMAVLAVWSLAITIVTGGRLMVPERHAMPCNNDRHALERHDERDDDGKQANELQTHGRIVLHAIGRAIARRVPRRIAAREWGIPASSAIFRLKPSMCLPAIFFHGGARARSPDEAQHCTSFGP